MEKRTVTLLIMAIGIALLGLVAVQALWVHGTLALRDAQFNESIGSALMAVSDRLERAEAHRQLGVLPGEGTGGGKIGPANTGADTLGALNDENLNELLRGILSGAVPRPINERIDPRLLDSLIREELQLRRISCRYAFGVLDDGGRVWLMGPQADADTAQVRNSPHRTQLFRSDRVRMQQGASTWWLHLLVPNRPSMLLRSLWPILATSGLLLLLVAVVFGYAMRTIFRQKRLGDIKNDLVNNLTHELKTPISTISLACEALMDPGMPKSEAQVHQLIGMVRDENKRLGMLVENVLLSAVTDQGGMRLRFTDVDMHAVLAEVVRSGALQAEKRGGKIELKAGAELAHVRGDRTFLTSIFHNLIDNAVKYCNASPIVNITTRSDASSLIISVCDNGIGIPRGEQKKIFDRLYRIPTGNIHNVKGFGLGLSYVKSVVERHGGSIRVENNPSAGSGTGSCFIITLPFEHEEDQTPAVRG